MTVVFDVKADTKAMAKDLRKVRRSIQRKAVTTAINRTAARVQVQSRRELASSLNVPQKPLRARMKRTKATWTKPIARLYALSARLLLASIGKPRQTKAGAGAGRHRVAGAFVAKMPSGHLGVFKRRGGRRLPIREQGLELSPITERVVGRLMSAFAPPIFRKEFDREMRRRLNSGTR